MNEKTNTATVEQQAYTWNSETELLERIIDAYVRRLQDIAAMASGNFVGRKTDGAFATHDIIAGVSDSRLLLIVSEVLKTAEQAGAIRATGEHEWLVVDEDALYHGQFESAVHALQKRLADAYTVDEYYDNREHYQFR